MRCANSHNRRRGGSRNAYGVLDDGCEELSEGHENAKMHCDIWVTKSEPKREEKDEDDASRCYGDHFEICMKDSPEELRWWLTLVNVVSCCSLKSDDALNCRIACRRHYCFKVDFCF